jgi:hypothetical protein
MLPHLTLYKVQKTCFHLICDVWFFETHTDQYSETNVMHLLLNLLRIEGLYMFRALFAHPQETLHKRPLVYCVRVMSFGCTRIGVELLSLIHNKMNKNCITLVPLQSGCS